MEKTFKINGKIYKAKPLDANAVCDIEEMGVSLTSGKPAVFSMARAYFALCCGKGKEYAGSEIEAHIVSGGKFDDLINVMNEQMEKSDFFRALQADKGTENQESETNEGETEQGTADLKKK